MVEHMVEPKSGHVPGMATSLAEPIAGVELILGGQKSGKSRRAEHLAQAWLAGAEVNGQPRQATLIATAQPWDAEMHQRIARHQTDRARRVPGMATQEEPLALAAALARLSAPHHLLVVDCLTLWLTNWLMPAENCLMEKMPLTQADNELFATLVNFLKAAPGPVVLVGNEIGLGVIPMGAEVRHFVDMLGQLNQAVAAISQRVVLMVAGLPLGLKP
jgi:adenosylcobinamide kinase/adenosylcobinamide-phosphate guanylyltransferase